MKAKASVLLFGVVALPICAQPFQNLNFEEANPEIVSGSPYYPNEIYASSGLPYWTVDVGGVGQTEIGYNQFFTGAPGVQLETASFQYAPAIDGNYAVLLQAGATPDSVSISQMAVIPSGMQSLLFKAVSSIGPNEVLIGNQVVPFIAVGGGPNYTLYGAEISAWAGMSEQLTFSALPNQLGPDNWEIDDITFSPSAVPEPSLLALTGVGGIILALRRRFWRR